MKKNTSFVVIFVTVMMLILFYGCVDYASESIINIKNESSYDLRLNFIYNIQLTNYDPNYWQSFDIDIGKNATHSFRLFGGLGSTVAPNPNWEFARIIFYNLNDETMLNDIEICDYDTIINNLFQLIETKDYKNYQNYFRYIIIYTMRLHRS